jgi:hypothetical protein
MRDIMTPRPAIQLSLLLILASPLALADQAEGEKPAAVSENTTRESEGESEASKEAQTPDEERRALDSELEGTLRQFDDMMLREQKLLEQRQTERGGATALGAEGKGEGEGGGRSGKGGGEGTDGASNAGGEGNSTAGGKSPAGQPGAAGADSGEQGGGDAQGGGEEGGSQQGQRPPGGAGSGSARVPPDIPDGADDDIIARQLREAAEQEEDPELREKLWDEYRAYKSGQAKRPAGSAAEQPQEKDPDDVDG